MKAFVRDTLLRQRARLHELDALLAAPDVVDDLQRFRALSREHAEAGMVVDVFNRYLQREADLGAAQDLLHDPEMAGMAQEEIDACTADLATLDAELQQLLLPKDPDDERNAFVEIRAGTGGDESALFAGDLARMITRYAESQRWTVEVVSESPSELGGYKEIVLRVVGHGAYGKLRFESGGHRVQRVPATETQGRIHTSAATVAVMPEPDETQAVQLNPSELRIDTYRASGAGGQHINKTDSAVRLTHIPTGIVVQCQDGRSQHSNRDVAWKRLRSKLYDHELRKQQEEQQKLEDTKTDVGWGHQIRSYVLDNSRIKDLRTNVEISATQKVLDGDLDPFIEASLKQGV
jgi:peptide chain release factor 1